MKAVNARVERIKKEKQLRLLEAQFHEYEAASTKLKDQAEDLTSVKDALYSKMQALEKSVKPLKEQEKSNMRNSVDADGSVTAPNSPDKDAATDTPSTANDASF